MMNQAWIMNRGFWMGTSILCRIDRSALDRVPARGPLILAANHVGSLEVPLLFAHLQPRQMVLLAKIETWDSRAMGWLFDRWESIPIRRGDVDLFAVHRCLEILHQGKILGLAPEGTRSRDGILRDARGGITVIALHSGSPILPLAHWGGEDFSGNLRHLRRTEFHIRVGKPFYLQTNDKHVNHEIRQEMVNEIMAQIAALMPERYRGIYAGMVGRPPRYLNFLPDPVARQD
jgi:1-acyl-sn-glycerol-3-phosphate acyltransferase